MLYYGFVIESQEDDCEMIDELDRKRTKEFLKSVQNILENKLYVSEVKNLSSQYTVTDAVFVF